MIPLILNQNFEVIRDITSYESFIWAERYNSYGDCEIYIPAPVSDDVWNDMTHDNYVYLNSSDDLMIIETREQLSNVEQGNHVRVQGRGLSSLLERRILWADTKITGSLQDGIESLLNACIISPEDEARKIPNFIFEKSDATEITSITIEETELKKGSVLYDAVRNLCENHKIGFKVTFREADNMLVFKLYKGLDHTYEQLVNPYIVFSTHDDNIADTNYIESTKLYRNVVFVQGKGKSTVTVGDVSGILRRELYCDSTNVKRTYRTDYAVKLTTAGEQALSKNNITKSLDGSITSTAVNLYNKELFLGDYVQLVDDYGHENTAQLTEVVITQDLNGYSLVPTFNTKKSDNETTEVSSTNVSAYESDPEAVELETRVLQLEQKVAELESRIS